MMMIGRGRYIDIKLYIDTKRKKNPWIYERLCEAIYIAEIYIRKRVQS